MEGGCQVSFVQNAFARVCKFSREILPLLLGSLWLVADVLFIWSCELMGINLPTFDSIRSIVVFVSAMCPMLKLKIVAASCWFAVACSRPNVGWGRGFVEAVAVATIESSSPERPFPIVDVDDWPKFSFAFSFAFEFFIQCVIWFGLVWLIRYVQEIPCRFLKWIGCCHCYCEERRHGADPLQKIMKLLVLLSVIYSNGLNVQVNNDNVGVGRCMQLSHHPGWIDSSRIPKPFSAYSLVEELTEETLPCTNQYSAYLHRVLLRDDWLAKTEGWSVQVLRVNSVHALELGSCMVPHAGLANHVVRISLCILSAYNAFWCLPLPFCCFVTRLLYGEMDPEMRAEKKPPDVYGRHTTSTIFSKTNEITMPPLEGTFALMTRLPIQQATGR